jgi:hypothetical protein
MCFGGEPEDATAMTLARRLLETRRQNLAFQIHLKTWELGVPTPRTIEWMERELHQLDQIVSLTQALTVQMESPTHAQSAR